MTIFNDQQLLKTLWAEYFGLQKRVDAEVSRILGLQHSPWKINRFDNQNVAELQATIRRMKFVHSAHSNGLIRMFRWFFKNTVADPDEFDGQGLA